MQKNFTHLFWTYQNYFSNQTSDLYSLNLVLDSSKWFERAIKRYEDSLPKIKDSLIEKILNAV